MARFSAKQYAARRLLNRLTDLVYIGLEREDVDNEITDAQLDRVNDQLRKIIEPLLPKVRRLAKEDESYRPGDRLIVKWYGDKVIPKWMHGMEVVVVRTNRNGRPVVKLAHWRDDEAVAIDPDKHIMT